MEMRTNRDSSRFPAAALLVGALALPGVPLLAQIDPLTSSPLTEAGPYTIRTVDSRHLGPGAAFAAVKKFGAFGLEGGGLQAVQSNTRVGLCVQSGSREDQMRLVGLAPQLSATDDRGRRVEVVGVMGPLPAAFAPGRKEDKVFQVQLAVPEGGARALKSLEGALLVTEARLQRLEFTGKDLVQGAEKTVGDHTLKLEPVKTSDRSATVQLSMKAALEGERAIKHRPGQPRVVVELTDTNGRSYEPRSISYSGTGVGAADGFFGGGALGRAFGAFPPGLPQGFGPRPPFPPQAGGPPANATFNSSFQTRYEFPPIHNDEEVKSVVCYVLVPTGDPKRIPFRLANVPLPQPPADVQKQP